MNRAVDFRVAVYAGLAAGILATVVQIFLWYAFTDAMPEILWRDMRFAAAIVVGRAVLPPPASLDPGVLGVATLVHFGLAVVYALMLGRLLSGLRTGAALVAGAVFGVCLYGVNMYGFTLVFPWFAASRDWITAASHVVFGVAAAGAYRIISHRRSGRSSIR
ncbi:MAG: sodium:proline symporter [Casimicrobiaceae bacterium]